MRLLRDNLGGSKLRFHIVESAADLASAADFVRDSAVLALDTESTGLDCYRPDWRLRLFQFGNASTAYVIPARYRLFIAETILTPHIRWLGHNGPHDLRCVNRWLGTDYHIHIDDTAIAAHLRDSRKQDEGGIGHALKNLACTLVHPDADKWESDLNALFRTYTVPLPGEVYASGPRRGQQKVRKALLSEGWQLVPDDNEVYLRYAAADPILTTRVWSVVRRYAREFREVYERDMLRADVCSALQTRGFRVDVPYTSALSEQYEDEEYRRLSIIDRYDCENINSSAQLARALKRLGVRLTKRTSKGAVSVDSAFLRSLLTHKRASVRDLVRHVLVARQLHKRRVSYTDAMLAGVDENDRIHPSINILGARTARMSVSNPALQQLPTKDRENELGDAI